MTYLEKLKDPRWQKKRLEILDDRGWACEVCCNKKSTLHIHHAVYFPNTEPWDYEDHLLRVLCDNCHHNEHEILKDLFFTYIDLLRHKEGLLYSELDDILMKAVDRFL